MLVQLAHDIEDFDDDHWGQPKRGFVEQEQLGPPHQGPGHGEHLLFAARERAARLAAALGQNRKQFVGMVQIVSDASSITARERAHLQVFEHGQTRENLAPFGRMADAQAHDVVRRQLLNLLTIQHDSPGTRPQAAGNCQQGRRLAGPIGADQGHDLARLHLDRNALEHLDRAIARLNVFHRK